MPCKHTSWQPAWAAGPDRGLNMALLGCSCQIAVISNPAARKLLPRYSSTPYN
jgi:hypothetical protein